MRIIRNEVGKHPQYGEVESYDIIGLDNEQHISLLMAIHDSIELYKAKGWDQDDEFKYRYSTLLKLHDALTDYRNHEKTFRKV